MKVSTNYKDIFRLAGPIFLALLIPQLNFLTNTIFSGRIGSAEGRFGEGNMALAVNAISGVFYLILSMVGYGLANGIQVQLSRRAGEGDRQGITRLLGNGILLTIFFSLSLMMLSLWLAPLIFGLSLNNNERFVTSIDFLFIRVWGLPFLMLTQLCNAYYISIGRSRNLMIASLASNFVNILLDYVLIYGKGGFPELGVIGVAWASIFAELVGFLVAWGIFYLGRYFRQYPIKRHLRFDPSLAQRMLRVSAPLIVQYFFSIGGWLVFFIFVEHLGQEEVAASQVLRSVLGIIGVVTWTFASTTASMVSNIIAQNRQNEVIGLVWKIARLSLAMTACICALLLLFPQVFLSWYVKDPAIISLAIPSLRMIVAGALVMSVSTVVFNGVVGTGNTMVNLTIEVTCVGLYLVYCYTMIERARLPLVYAWASELVYWTSLLSIGWLYLRSKRWMGKQI